MERLEIPLQKLDALPDGIEETQFSQVAEIFPHPTLIQLEGRRKDPLFLSLLLHGNETSSFYVLKKLNCWLKKNELPRSLIIFIGNVYAASEGRRFLNNQCDYNRIWKGGEKPEHNLAQQILDLASGLNLFASIDIHNNTGANPHYACVNILESRHIQLGSLFSRTIVYYNTPNTAQSMAFSKFCPAVTLECGPSGDEQGVEKAFQFVIDTLHLQSFEHQVKPNEVNIYQTIAKIETITDLDFGFIEGNSTALFVDDFEKWNFTELHPGFVFAHINNNEMPLRVFNDDGVDCTDQFFKIDGNKLILTQKVIPSMLTTDKEVIRQDCLGYIMKHIEWKI